MGSANGEDSIREQCAREEERILVSVRMRPLNEKETSRNEVIDWECIDDTTIIYKNHLSPERTMYPTSYTFDRVFRSDSSTRQVYEEGAKSVVLSAVSGINSSVFAYGQTSSGKTFTMSGITEYTMEDIFDYIHKHKEREFQLKFSAMEIYNESVRDLLSADNSSLRLLDDPERGTVVEKLTEITLYDWNHFKELLVVCEAQRQIGETFLNEASSRSHQILRLTIESSTREFLGKNNSSHLIATLDFVDLAGSERASQALSAGSRLKEGSHINRSLLTLGTVIRKLSKGRTGHIPYRDSKLTRILQSSLGGNARTAIICTMSPAQSYVEQSRNTLLFASCAKEVATDAHVNVVMSDKVLVKHLQRELARLENELRIANPLVKADAIDLLREKDSKIEELERCLRELSLRLDVALSQINDLQQGTEHRSPALWEREYSYYPRLHVRPAPESFFVDANIMTDHHSFDAGSPGTETPHSPDRQSRLSYDDNYSISDLEENLTPSSPFEQVLIKTPTDATSSIFVTSHPKMVGLEGHQVRKGYGERVVNISNGDLYMVTEKIGEQNLTSCEIDQYKVFEEIREQTPGTSETCRQLVSDGHGAPSTCFVQFDPHQVSDEMEEQTPEAIRKQKNDHLEVQCIESTLTDKMQINSLPLEEERKSLPLMDQEKVRHTDNELKQETELSNINLSSLQDPKESSGKQQIDGVGVKNQNTLHSTTGISNNMSGTSSAFVGKSEYEMSEQRDDDDKSSVSSVKYDANSEVPQISKDVDIHDIPVTEIKDASHIDYSDNLTSVAEMKEETKSQCMDQVSNLQLEDTSHKANKSIKNMKDVGSSPQGDLDTTSPLLSDFKRLQEEIIDLWDTCSVSLVHRTYFFLLFIMGDSKDTIYMEVERRRFSFIKDAFSWRNSIVVDGRKLTPSSSKRSLHREREILGRLMKKRFSSRERKDLYVKWGINLDAKRRSSQLAHRLWTDTIDMDHIKESANIVAKLVRFSRPQVPKEVFGLNLTNLGPGKSFSFRWKHNLSLVM